MITYDSIRKKYVVFIKGKYLVSYTFNKFGDYAKMLAELSNKTAKKYPNYYTVNDDGETMTMKLFSKKHGSHDIIIDMEDYINTSSISWRIAYSEDKSYVTSPNGMLGRYILGLGKEEDDNIINYIDGDTLNHRKSNLEIVKRLIHIIDMNNFDSCVSSKTNKVWSNTRIRKYVYRGIERYKFVITCREKLELYSKKVRKEVLFDKENFDSKLHEAILLSIRLRREYGYELLNTDLDYLKLHGYSE